MHHIKHLKLYKQGYANLYFQGVNINRGAYAVQTDNANIAGIEF